MLVTEERSVPEEDIIEIEDEPQEDTRGHGVVNPMEARHHVQLLDEVMQALEAKVNTGEIKNILRDTLEEVYQAISNTVPAMKEASTADVLKSIKDPTCLILHEGLEHTEQLLEDIISEEDISSGRSMIEGAQKVGNLMDEQRGLITELFELMEVAYDHEARACSCLARLSRTLNAQQLQVILQSSIKPLITLKALPKYAEQIVAHEESKRHPEDRKSKIMQTITPDTSSHPIRKEEANSPTPLLVATFAFKIINKFGGGTTQRKMQEVYNIKAKQLAMYITGHKYLGGVEKRARKRKLSGDGEQSSTSAQ